MTLRHDLEALVADWPHRDAAPVLRVAAILNGRDDTYWRSRGRERVERELAEDGLSADKIDAVVLAVEGEPSEEVSLERILADMIAREQGA